MKNWVRWVQYVAALLFVVGSSWWMTTDAKPPSHHFLHFVVTTLLCAIVVGLTYFPGLRFLIARVLVIAALMFFFWRWQILPSWSGIFPAAFAVAFAAMISSLRPFDHHWAERGPWWPAAKRTFRRLRGDWRKDDAQFAAKVFGKEKPSN